MISGDEDVTGGMYEPPQIFNKTGASEVVPSYTVRLSRSGPHSSQAMNASELAVVSGLGKPPKPLSVMLRNCTLCGSSWDS